MAAHILSLATATPPYVFQQDEVVETMIDLLRMEAQEADYLRKLYGNTAIETRHSVLPDFNLPRHRREFWGQDYPEKIPGTRRRNEVYKQEAPKLACQAAEKALKQWGQEREKITHVVAVSCTGVCVPGIEFQLIDRLQLNPAVVRLGVNFMGCFGAFQGLNVAKAFACERPQNRVLVVCVELCSLHMQADRRPETLIANALFSDGAACAIVGGEVCQGERSLYEVIRSHSFGIAGSEREITWDIGERGFFMQLTKKVPSLIRQNLNQFASHLLGEGVSSSACTWAVHPGGKAIIHAVEQSLKLEKGQTEHSWEIFRRHGNLSSATVLFILEELARKAETEHCVGLGFGPGLAVEGLLLRHG